MRRIRCQSRAPINAHRASTKLQLKSRSKFDVRSTSVEDEESQREIGWRRVAGRFNSLSI
ncbi:hypothetical protein ALC62_02131 [Cyphomyrmex costatus]|uniref:Uncharacterized protein n=1 Tax=Cyphomyrmex costatus TaxID=456900 RepID=A0A195D225_9HYME|nr:hypothetical protein ALC62_02131 [Cyphomyrmex costatus]